MKNWKPPLRPDPFYAHVFRWFLRLNSRKRAGMTDKVKEVITEEGEEEFHWRYAILETKQGGQTYYQVCEEYPGLGYTDGETPLGESPEELQHVLEMMLADVKGAIAHKNIITKDAPYDDWRAKDLAEGPFLSAEETEEWLDSLKEEDDIGNDPTVPFAKEFENEED